MDLACHFALPTTGEKDLCPIILLHAILDSKKTWRVVAPQIADDTGRMVYYFDARNHGDSSRSRNFTLEGMVDDVMALMDTHGIHKAILLGSGMGGSVAMRLALEKPERFEKLIVEDMVPEPFPKQGWKAVLPMIRRLRSALEEIPESSNPTAAKAAITNYFNPRLPVENQNHKHGLYAMPLKRVNGKYEWEANLSVIEKALKKKDFDVGLKGTYDGEVLFLYGRQLFLKIQQDKIILNLFPRAVRILVRGAIRRTHFEVPEEFVKHVVKFINGTSAPESYLETQNLM